MADVNWRMYAEVATGLLGWSPDIFWASTPEEFRVALKGWQSFRQGAASVIPLKREEMAMLLDRFPDD